jgi:DNA-binding transcriptional ArsR family regulator
MTNRGALLSAFSDPTRQAVLNLLRERPCTVGELASRLPVSRPAVSQHLNVLKSAGLVGEERRGTRHYFHLNARTLAELRDHVDAMWRDALAAFSQFASKSIRKETDHGGNKAKPPADSKKRLRRLSG